MLSLLCIAIFAKTPSYIVPARVTAMFHAIYNNKIWAYKRTCEAHAWGRKVSCLQTETYLLSFIKQLVGAQFWKGIDTNIQHRQWYLHDGTVVFPVPNNFPVPNTFK